jgi:hypothetical protein
MLLAVINCLVLAIGFALVRRALGGWLKKGKVIPYVVGIGLLLSACILMGSTVPVFAALVAGMILHFQGFGVGRHEPDGPLWNSTIRYGVVPAILAVAAGVTGNAMAIPGLLVVVMGSVASCWVVRIPRFVEWANKFAVSPVHFLDSETNFIDGHLCFAELGLGASWGLGVGIALAMM